MDYLADRTKCIDASGIRRVWQMASKVANPINFCIGEPDFPAPPAVKAAAIKAIQENHNTYTLTAGYEPLRQELAQLTTARFGWEKPHVIVTCGVSGGLNLALWAAINPGDEVLITDPYFVMYKHLVNMIGGKCVFIDTYPDFQLDGTQLEKKITPKTKMIIVNSPANPSGAVYTAQQLQAVAAVAKKHNLLVISDEIYEAFSYDAPAASLADYYENTLLMGGFSKAYGIPGWRLGYIAVPNHLSQLFDKMATIQQYTFVCAPHPFQIAALTALKYDNSAEIAGYRRKRDLIYEGLKDAFGLVKPQGAFYAFVPAPGGNATKFVDEAIKNNVFVIPGSVFSERDSHFRISYATSDAIIRQGIEKLCQLAKKGW